MQTYSFLVDLAGTVLAIAFLVFSFIYVHNDLKKKKKRDLLHFFFVLFFFFVVQMILKTDKGTNFASDLTPTHLRLLVNEFWAAYNLHRGVAKSDRSVLHLD